jgi:triosephosphate isomerase
MKPLIVANWKMNPPTLAEAKELFNSVKKGIKNIKRIKVVICPPFVYLPILRANGSQDCFWEEKGAYTGEVSPKMLKNLGLQYVILGHSERRKYQKETDEIINKKIKAALKEKLKPILCIDNISQIKKDLKGITKKELRNLFLAYEPLFAIGTGRPCSIEKAKKMRILIQRKLKRNAPVLYGGSLNSQNAKNYIKEAGFQGLLIGGASLNPQEFLRIVKSIDPVRNF